MVAISWLAGRYLLKKWRDKELHSISEHAASHPIAMRLFAGVLISCGAIFYWWLIFWLAPRLGLHSVFQTIAIVTFIFQTITAVIADVPGRKRTVHRLTAYTMAFLFIPLAWLVVFAPATSVFAKVFGILAAAYMTTSFFWGVVLKRSRDKFLTLQVIYIMTLQLVVLVAAYL